MQTNFDWSPACLVSIAILLGESRPIIVDTASTGKPELPCKVLAKGPTGPYVELPTKKVPEGYECVYKPDQSGPNSVKVEYAEQEVPKSPYHVQVDEKVDESNVEIKGLESRKCLGIKHWA